MKEKSRQQKVIADALRQTGPVFSDFAKWEEYGRRCLREAFEYLDAMISPERRISERPRINFEDIDCGFGRYAQGSEVIDIHSKLGRWAIASVVPHEAFHFFQYRDGFTQRAKEFKYLGPGRYTRLADLLNEGIGGVLEESGAHFFGLAFITRFQGSGMVKSLETELVRRPDDDQRPYEAVLQSIYNTIKNDDMAWLLSAGREFPKRTENESIEGFIESLRELIRSSQVISGRAIALMVFAATEHDVSKTVNILISDPERILNTVKAMGDDRFHSLTKEVYADLLRP